jgi:hypothetical protein
VPEDRESTTVEQAENDGAANPVSSAQGPGQAGHDAVLPVPAPGHAESSAGPGVRAAQGASPEDGIVAADKSEGSDASVSSPGSWTAIAAPGKPDGEVDTRG